MRKNVCVLGVVLCVLTGWCGLLQGAQNGDRKGTIEVLLAYNPALVPTDSCVIEAYKSVLQEEGVPFRIIDVEKLSSLPPDALPSWPALILPEGVTQGLPERFDEWLKTYLHEGGSVLIGYDAGTKDQNGYYRDRAALTDIIGLNYILYNQSPEYAFSYGSVRFTDRSAMEMFEIPPGITNEKLDIVGYQYQTLKYPFARSIAIKDLGSRKILAYIVDADSERYPGIVETRYGKGTALYMSFPLSYLKCNSDDLLLRSSIRFLLFKSAKIPHIMSVPGGKGGLVINWHIDSNAEWIYLPLLKKKGYFRDSIKYSFHITAGNYDVQVGDASGFDASGKGQTFVKMIMPYGLVGSHGGWAHNWFADKVISGEFKEKEIEAYIMKNNRSLEEILGYKIKEYSAPVGSHPQPIATRVLERLGIIAFYYCGDSGSAPNRTFWNGKMLSERVVAFPVTKFGDTVSLEEMKKKGKTPAEVYRWLTDVADYTARNRVVRMIYSHPNDVKYYPKTVWDFLDHISSLQKDGEISIEPMTYYAEFFLRFLKTRYDFTYEGPVLSVCIKNPEGLKHLTIAIPKQEFVRPEIPQSGLSFNEDETYFYITIEEDGMFEKVLSFRRM